MSKNGKVLAAVMERHTLCVVNGLTDKSKGLITREMSTINGIERSVIDFVIVSSDLVKHIKNIHIDDKRINVLTKNVKTKEGTITTKSDHNIIETKFNIKWSRRSSKVIEVFKFKDTVAQHRFKIDTTETTELSRIIVQNKPIDIVTKKLVKRIKSFIHKNFKKLRIVDKPDKNLEEFIIKEESCVAK